MGDSPKDVPPSDPEDKSGSAPTRKDALAVPAKDVEVAGEPTNTSAFPIERGHPRQIGGYRIVSVLGQGGMGIVYEAQQVNPQRAVALKVVRSGNYLDAQSIRLFQREAQTLARLKHPNIASIYEAGGTEDGEHFFAMELVRGKTLNLYLRQRQLSIRERLELFCQICQTIHYAHQKAVIHRDLKPSNILIDNEGRPKVLDFGLARITDLDITVTTVVTDAGRIMGTLAYMSPEQARGNPDEIDLRSDVYSLGVILFEMLTGRFPYNVGHSALHEAVRTICEATPQKPSGLDRRLGGDLETIILKALEKESARRFQSAAALGDDIERYLARQPIQSRPPSTLYQLGKLISRHKVPFAFIIALFVVTAGSGVWMRQLYHAERRQHARAIQAENIAEEKAETAIRVQRVLEKMFTSADPTVAKGQDITVRQVLDESADLILAELDDQPRVKGALMNILGNVNRSLGNLERAYELLLEALNIRRQVYGRDHAYVAESMMNIGWVLKARGDYDGADKYLRQALRLHRGATDPQSKIVLADNLHLLGTTARESGRGAEARDLLQEACTLKRSILGSDSSQVADCWVDLASVHQRLGDFTEADRLVRQALELWDQVPGPMHPHRASALQLRAKILRSGGHYLQAEQEMRKALELRRQSYDPDHHLMGTSYVWIGALLCDQRRFEESDKFLRKGLDNYLAQPNVNDRFIASALRTLAWLRLEQGIHDEAKSLFERALGIYKGKERTDRSGSNDAKLGLACLALAEGDYRTGETLAKEVMVASATEFSEDNWRQALAESVLGQCLMQIGLPEEAEKHLLQSFQVMSRQRGQTDRYVVAVLRRIIDLYSKLGRPDQAADWRRRLAGASAGEAVKNR